MGMYDSLKGNVGRSLFLLYKAIKHQTNKGPVDVVTNEAKYSLAEENLLREKIDPTILVQNWFLRIFVDFEIFLVIARKLKRIVNLIRYYLTDLFKLPLCEVLRSTHSHFLEYLPIVLMLNLHVPSVGPF